VRLTVALLGLAGFAAACTVGLPDEQRTDEQRGRQLVVAYGCTSCHQVPGTEVPQGRVGPPLGSFADRRAVAGRLPNTAENAARWIREPQEVDPRTIMPDLGVTEQDARDIVAYLYSLRERAEGGGNADQPASTR
jgi:cytochrome c1